MFTILTTDLEDTLYALFLLSYYQVKFSTQSDAEDPFSTMIIVDEETREGDLRNAEMCFQMNFRQVGHICPVCKEENPEESFCGHLTFKGQIAGFPWEQKKEEPVDFKLEPMTPIPANSNPFHYDMDRMGTPINKRFMAMYHMRENEVVLVDMKLGNRVKIIVPQVEVEEED